MVNEQGENRPGVRRESHKERCRVYFRLCCVLEDEDFKSKQGQKFRETFLAPNIYKRINVTCGLDGNVVGLHSSLLSIFSPSRKLFDFSPNSLHGVMTFFRMLGTPILLLIVERLSLTKLTDWRDVCFLKSHVLCCG